MLALARLYSAKEGYKQRDAEIDDQSVENGHGDELCAADAQYGGKCSVGCGGASNTNRSQWTEDTE